MFTEHSLAFSRTPILTFIREPILYYADLLHFFTSYLRYFFGHGNLRNIYRLVDAVLHLIHLLANVSCRMLLAFLERKTQDPSSASITTFQLRHTRLAQKRDCRRILVRQLRPPNTHVGSRIFSKGHRRLALGCRVGSVTAT